MFGVCMRRVCSRVTLPGGVEMAFRGIPGGTFEMGGKTSRVTGAGMDERRVEFGSYADGTIRDVGAPYWLCV
ncbi:MAG: hypothetical protein ACJA00_005580 [Myxococcota bacterium]|jgi:hypothetical protein